MLAQWKLSPKQKKTLRRTMRTPLGILAILLLLTGMSLMKQSPTQNLVNNESQIEQREGGIPQSSGLTQLPQSSPQPVEKKPTPDWSADGPHRGTVIR